MPIQGGDGGLPAGAKRQQKTTVTALYPNSFGPQQTRMTKRHPLTPRLKGGYTKSGFVLQIISLLSPITDGVKRNRTVFANNTVYSTIYFSHN
jgi:hypothetical protein